MNAPPVLPDSMASLRRLRSRKGLPFTSTAKPKLRSSHLPSCGTEQLQGDEARGMSAQGEVMRATPLLLCSSEKEIGGDVGSERGMEKFRTRWRDGVCGVVERYVVSRQACQYRTRAPARPGPLPFRRAAARKTIRKSITQREKGVTMKIRADSSESRRRPPK